MSADPRRLLQFALLVATLNARAASPYLPLVGPPALRFETPRVEAPVTQPLLPPLPLFEPKAAVSAPPVPVETPAATSTGSIPAATNPETRDTKPSAPGHAENPEPQAPEPSPNSAKAELPPGPIENLTPQMFMKFFSGRPGTNHAGSSTTIYAPLPFIPPVPAVPPSSTATFQNTPPAKP